MRTTAFGTAALAAAAVLGLSHTASGAIHTNLVADGITWEYAYEANMVPDGGTLPFLNGISASNGRVPSDRLSISDGVFRQDTTVLEGDGELLPEGISDWAQYWQTTGTLWNTAAPNGTTVELKAAIIGDADDDSDTPVFYIRMGIQNQSGSPRNVWLHFSDGWVGLSNSLSSVSSPIQLDTSVMHTYRILLTPVSATVVAAELYIDGVSQGTLASSASGSNNMRWGEESTTGAGGAFDLDYLRWTNQGAYVIPEPAALVMFASAGLWLLGRRR